MAFAWTRPEDGDEELLFALDSRDKRSRTTCGISTRRVVMVRSLRYFLSLVRCGDGGRGRSRTLSFFESVGLSGTVGLLGSLEGVGLRGGVGNDAGVAFC
jgi:hypothetical protein